jgi:predicted O-linked N-acetylglucosamine transferase (SPINDLY family)
VPLKPLLRIFGRSVRSPQEAPVDANMLDDLIVQGNDCEDRGDYAKALEMYQRAVAMSPDSARAHLNLGNTQSKLGRQSHAIASYRHAAALQPDWLPPHLNLGALLLRKSDAGAAEASYREALRLAPDSAAAWIGLGCALDDQSVDAEAAFRSALNLLPGHAGAASRLALWLRTKGRAREALHELQTALADNPDDVLLLRTLGEVLAAVGDPATACATYRKALQASPRDWGTWDNVLWTLNFIPEADANQILAEHRCFGAAMEQLLETAANAPSRRERQRLRIGYVSADFRGHPVSCFIEPLLRHHDRNRFDVHCFYNYPSRDVITERLFGLVEHWHDIAEMSDDEVARRVRDNGIDILVDLGGHTLHNRLGVFARRPAPLQFTWLGYLCTTGLRAMDYRLCDAHTDPPGRAEAWQVETPMRLPDSQWCYQPQVELPLPTSLPFLRNGYWTFGSFNQESKLNGVALHAWARILGALPESRLRVVGVSCDVVEERIRGIFCEHGVAAQRVEIIGRIPIEEYFAAYRDVDIALDTFPYNGATTTCDALLMGVPVVSFAGDRAIARGGVSLLTTVGLHDWIAPSAEAIVEIVRTQVADPQRLVALRRDLPARMRASALMDGARFAKNLEGIFEQAWRRG